MFSELGCTEENREVEYGLPPSEVGAGAEVWFFLSRINALTISFSSATSDETAGVEELVLTLEIMALLRDLERTLDLLAMNF
ncbi:hypothetical protein Tco_1394905 [Tanacetum coccineum]